MGRWYVGQKIRAVGRLVGDRGQVVKAGATGLVTNVPGPKVRMDRGAECEVRISGIVFDAFPGMILAADAPSGRSAVGNERGNERRSDPTLKAGAPGSDRKYTHKQFLEFYGPARGVKLWEKAGGAGGRSGGADKRQDPTVKRNDKDFGRVYSREQFDKFYGPKDGSRFWSQAGRAGGARGGAGGEEKRADPTVPAGKGAGKTYTREQFLKFYGPKDGPKVWKKAATGAGGRGGEDRRKDPTVKKGEKLFGKTYTFAQFEQFYGPKDAAKLWKKSGGSAPAKAAPAAERRTDPTDKGSKKTYTKEQFAKFYGAKDAAKLWKKGKVVAAAERRADPTVAKGNKQFGKTYTREDFERFYGKNAGKVWKAAAPKGGKAAAKKEKKVTYEFVEAKLTIKRDSAEASIGWNRDPKKQFLRSVDKESPAAKAGVARGMRLLAIAGKAVETDEEVKEALKAAGAEFEVTVNEKKAVVPERKPRPPPKHPVLVRPSGNKKLALGRNLKCEEEGSTLLFDFKDGTILAGEESLEVADGKVTFGKIGEGGATDGQKWELDHGRLRNSGKVLTFNEDGTVDMQEERPKAKEQQWSFASGEKGEKKAAEPKEPKEKKPRKPRPPPKHPVTVHPRLHKELSLCRSLKCEEEGATLAFDFQADGSVLAGEESLQVADGKLTFGKIAEGGPTDGQKWAIDSGRLRNGDNVLTLNEDKSVGIAEAKDKDKAQQWSFVSTVEVEKRRDPTDPSSKKRYTEEDFVKFYGKKLAAKYWKQAAPKAPKAPKAAKPEEKAEEAKPAEK